MVRNASEAQPNTALRELRLRRGWSQGDLAEAFNQLAGEQGTAVTLTANDVSRWERGTVTAPQPIKRRVLAELLDVTQEELGFLSRAGEPYDGPDVRRSQQQWVQARRALNRRRRELTRIASQLYPEAARLGDTGVLMASAWQLSEPIDLASIKLVWEDETPPPSVDGHEDESRHVRPLHTPERRYERYHRAVRDLDPPRLFENRLCYRLLDIEWSDPNRQLTFGSMGYFDAIDVGEAAAHELALRHLDAGGRLLDREPSWDGLPFRRLLRDPFAITVWPLLLSISTLTIRSSRAGATFLLLRRNPARVAVAGGMLSVAPTGVFQPASVLPAPRNPDFNLWHNVMREYSEEFLGNSEHDGNGPPADYDNEHPFTALNEARVAGKIRVYALGVGIDALNLVGDVLTVAVVESNAFDEIFHGLVALNDEGTIEREDDERQQYAFNESTIERLLRTQPMAPSGAACLQLAWQHRAMLLPNQAL